MSLKEKDFESMITKYNPILKKILLIDDEIIFANALQKKLLSLGYDIFTANSELEANESLQENEIQLILIDIDLEDEYGGIDSARRILTKENIPIVFQAAYFEKEDLTRVNNVSRYGILIKNSPDAILKSTIETAYQLFISTQRIKEFEAIASPATHPEEQINSMLNYMPDGIVIFDTSWRYIYANNSAIQLIGLPIEQILGKIYWEAFPEVIGTQFLEIPKEAMALQKPIEFDEYYPKYNVWVYIRCYPTPTGLTLIFQNITERKESEKKAKNISQFLNSIVENIPNMIFLKKAEDLKFVLFNQAGEKLLGFNRNDLIGKNDYDFFPKEQADFFTQKDRDVLNQKETIDIAEEFIDTPIGKRILHTKKLPLFGENGQVEYLLGISEDITEQKENQKRIQESIELYDRLTSTVPGALYDYVLHDDGRSQMVFISAKAMELFEVDPKEIMKDMNLIWNLFHPDDIERVQMESEYAVRNSDKFSTEARIITPSGKEKWIQITSRPNPIQKEGEPAIWSGFVIDITNRKQAEEKIKTLLGEKEILLREVHHRIKNNMLTITSLLFLQTESLRDKAAILALNDAISRIQSMVVLYDKLYRSSEFNELSVIEYLSPLIDEIVNNFPNYQIVQIEKQIDKFVLSTSLLFPIGIIINEILTNAMKYAFVNLEKGIIKVSALKKENNVYISIEDDGVGLPELNDESEGFGLQLVTMLAKQIRGKISLKNENGTKFALEFVVR